MLRQDVSYFCAVLLAILANVDNCSAQSISIFGNAAPAALENDTDTPITGGVKFWSAQSGTISAIRFYRATTSPNGYVARLYTASGGVLGSVKLAHESGPVPGWQVAQFAAPISIAANKTYVAAYYTPSGADYQLVPYALTSGVTNGPLTAPAASAVGGNGTYIHALAFPTTSSGRNSSFLADVVFTPVTPTPYLMLSFNPPNPTVASNAPAGTVVATITANWSNGTPFTGTLSFGAPDSNDKATFAISGNQLIVNTAGPGLSADGGTSQLVTIVATQ
jgi:Domain of unknown function (DUF4082)